MPIWLTYPQWKDGRSKLAVNPFTAIHKAHTYLLKKSVSLCNKTIVTIFINKPQFNKISDYKNYPRNLEKDISIINNKLGKPSFFINKKIKMSLKI